MSSNLNSLSKRRLALLLLPLVLGTACKQVDNLQDMHDSTQKMASDVDRTRIAADSTYTDLRQGNSLTIRSEALTRMESIQSMEAKISEAGLYFMAFEFQLCKNQGFDNQEVCNDLYEDAMIQFFRDLTRYMGTPKGVLDPSSAVERDRNLFALSVALHRENPTAHRLAVAQGSAKAVSMQSLIKDTLRKRDKVASGEIGWQCANAGRPGTGSQCLKAFEREMLSHEKEALFLLQARANFLPAMLLSKITRVAESNLLERGWMAFVGTRASFDDLKFAELQTYLTWIEEANSLMNFFNEIGAPLEIHSLLKAFLKNLALPQAGTDPIMTQISEQAQRLRKGVEQALINETTKLQDRLR